MTGNATNHPFCSLYKKRIFICVSVTEAENQNEDTFPYSSVHCVRSGCLTVAYTAVIAFLYTQRCRLRWYLMPKPTTIEFLGCGIHQADARAHRVGGESATRHVMHSRAFVVPPHRCPLAYGQ